MNTETRKGQPAKLVPGAPLPEERLALPLPEDIGGSPYHPETDATVQPDAASHIWPLSSETVAEPVAQAPPVAQPQPPMQPPKEPVSDTKTAPEGPPVAVLHTDQHEVDTPTPTHPPCPHRPLGEVEDRWQHGAGGDDPHACACCGGPVAPEHWQDGFCPVCRNGQQVKAGSGHLVRLALDMGATPVEKGG